MAKERELGWEEIVLICAAILFIIAFFKFLFWVSIFAFIISTIWLIFNISNQSHESSPMAAGILIISLVVAVVSFHIGYGFEQSAIGKPIVQSARTIVEADNNINNAMNQANQQIIEATINATT